MFGIGWEYTLDFVLVFMAAIVGYLFRDYQEMKKYNQPRFFNGGLPFPPRPPVNQDAVKDALNARKIEEPKPIPVVEQPKTEASTPVVQEVPKPVPQPPKATNPNVKVTYCLHCRDKREIINSREESKIDGKGKKRTFLTGACSVCGQKIFLPVKNEVNQ